MNNLSRYYRKERRVPMLKFPINLEIGCGDAEHKRKDHVGLDIRDYGQDILCDVEDGIPLPDNSCLSIYASHVFEHLENLVFVMNECHRVLQKRGELWIIVPHISCEKAYVPSHIIQFNKYTFDFFQYPEYAKNYNGSCWEIKEYVENQKKHIHVKMTPIK